MSNILDKARPVAWLDRLALNDGKVSGFKPGDKIEISNQRGRILVGEVWGVGPKKSELWVVVGDVTYLVRRQRPTSYPRGGGALRPSPRRDAQGRFTR